MTTITAEVIEDSIYQGKRITTLELYYPRIIHSEFMTHRVFSRNAGSSRAIPVKRLLSSVVSDPYVPEFWGLNQKGMQAQEVEADPIICRQIWLEARDDAVRHAQRLADQNVHKQHVNRIIEPYTHIRVVVTATGDAWPGFFYLRDHPDAQPEIQKLARAILKSLESSTPVERTFHLPYVTQEERGNNALGIQDRIMMSAARCARVSYRTHDGLVPRLEEDMELSGKLWGDPPHLSPFEHPAVFGEPEKRYANFTGWQSYRNYKGY